MITRNDIANQLKLLAGMEKSAKDIAIDAYLESQDVPEEERDKILSDLVSYEDY